MDTRVKGFGGIIGTSLSMQRVYEQIRKVSSHRFPVLISGETGTGKELVARSIHFVGTRGAKPFVPVDCAGLQPTLIEAELFGYVKGAFTGAFENRRGLLASAGEGTVFLDEIGELPLCLQPKLLRTVQESQFRPVGSNVCETYSARILAATNRDLTCEVEAGSFRRDLYFRIAIVRIVLPPLREHAEDIPLLVEFLIEKHDGAGTRRTMSGTAMRRLLSYGWPGNIRELDNVVQRSLCLSDETSIADAAFSPEQAVYAERSEKTDELVSLRELEQRAINRALRETNGNKDAAARMLGIGKTTLYRKIRPNSGSVRRT
jgi:transcriptional regulator with GAF, ATPase, and Fis domain